VLTTWIASYPKSGNTWTRFVAMAYQNPETFTPNTRPGNHFIDMDPRYWQRVSPIDLHRLHKHEFYMLRQAALLHMRRSVDGPIFIKTHHPNMATDGIPLIPPKFTERAVIVVRDPRDVAVSFAAQSAATAEWAVDYLSHADTCMGTVDGVPEFISSWSNNVASWKAASFPIMVLRYEDMLAEPERVFGETLEFCGFKVSVKRLRTALELTAFERLQRFEMEHGFLPRPKTAKRFFREGRADQWKDALTPEQARRIEADHGAMMSDLGYAETVRDRA
jgi:hypothetical protein